jgi:alkylation response protein AidB-like acyl-CoA dehydrogenase
VDFSLTQEQVLLQDSVGKFVSATCDVERHRRLSKTELAFDPAAWATFAELGWLGIPFSEEQGGIGGSAVDVMVTCESLGRGLLREPFLATVVTCGGFLRRASVEQQNTYIPGIIDGSAQWAFACAEPGGAYNLAAVACQAEEVEAGYRLSGAKVAVLNAHCADYLVVSARTSGASHDKHGISLFIVDCSLPGVERTPFAAVDGSRGANVQLDGVLVGAQCLLGSAGEALSVIEAVVDEAILAMGGDAVGAMQVLLDATVEYTRTREQFGQPISKFQALQHRMAEMYLKIEETRSLLYNAAIQLDEGSEESAGACAALKVKLAEAGKFVSQEAVQLHGGIGMTDELIVGHHFKRLMLLAKLYGDESYYLQRYVQLQA